jgi:MFS family permease
MNTEDFDTLWNAQRPAADTRRPEPAELARQIEPELRRRSRFLGYELFSLTLGLVLTPVLAVANARHLPPHNPLVYWLHVGLFVAAALFFLANAIRRLRRHRELTQTRADALTTAATRSLAAIEGEMRDYRLALQSLPVWLGLVLLSVYANQPVAQLGWAPLLVRMGAVLAFVAVIGAVCWRHYRKNLAPEHSRRKWLVEQLA